ncbi:MAG: A/G-specific adenine glycosylase [Spirochaetaceae bacterium]|jgi:A/G-specific adenine glycosylase|nr:A/G-specific adenine glycosylase [Spirochaetaceae bacterium]
MPQQIAQFKDKVFAHYNDFGRKNLPWRLDFRPWGVLVSEFMLQQTQIERVIPYWERWMTQWPDARALSSAALEEALRMWSGLGYNRRGRALWECSRQICEKYSGEVPRTPEELITLPGIGPYSSGAIACFAWNYPAIFIETNIRAALIGFFFAGKETVHDNELIPLLEAALDWENPRLWYWALMDYGSALKKTTPNPNRRSAHYARQSRFEGSFRQLRSALLRELLAVGPVRATALRKRTGLDNDEFRRVTASLIKDQMICCRNGVYMIP